MNMSSPVVEWPVALRNLAIGVSIATYFLVPVQSLPSQHAATDIVTEAAELVTVLPDGALDPRFAFYRTSRGLRTPVFAPDYVSDRLVDAQKPLTREDVLDDLRRTSGISVEALARIAGVSRNAYYKWLRGGGVKPENLGRLIELRDALHIIRTVRGGDMMRFLQDPGPLGIPIDLLASGRVDEVIGIAFRSPTILVASAFSQEARAVAALPSGFRSARRLAWNRPAVFDDVRQDVWESARPTIVFSQGAPNARDEVADASDELSPYSARGFFLE